MSRIVDKIDLIRKDLGCVGRIISRSIDKHIAGQVMITRQWSDWRNGYFWWIQSVYVKKKYSRIGVYSVLHNYVNEQAKIMGAVGLRLYVDSTNQITLYMKNLE